jgi:hypothetical protein
MEADLRKKLLDPDSARLTWWAYPGKGFYCGLVNSKNGFGGYAGNALFYAAPDPPMSTIENDGSDGDATRRVAFEMCRSSGYGDELDRAGYF